MDQIERTGRFVMHGISRLGIIKPTGEPVALTGVNVDCVVDRRIVEHGDAANMLGPLLEIGAIQAVDSDTEESSSQCVV